MRKNLLESLIIQLISFFMLFVGIIITYFIKKDIEFYLIISGIIFILDLILFAKLADTKYVSICTVIALFANGVAIGSFVIKYSTDIALLLKVFIITISTISLIHLFLILVKYKIFMMFLNLSGILIGSIISFTLFKNDFYKILSFVLINVFCIEIGLLIFLYAKDSLEACLTGGAIWAFIIVFIIIIIIIIVISEGDALSGIDGLGSGGKKRNKGK